LGNVYFKSCSNVSKMGGGASKNEKAKSSCIVSNVSGGSEAAQYGALVNDTVAYVNDTLVVDLDYTEVCRLMAMPHRPLNVLFLREGTPPGSYEHVEISFSMQMIGLQFKKGKWSGNVAVPTPGWIVARQDTQSHEIERQEVDLLADEIRSAQRTSQQHERLAIRSEEADMELAMAMSLSAQGDGQMNRTAGTSGPKSLGLESAWYEEVMSAREILHQVETSETQSQVSANSLNYCKQVLNLNAIYQSDSALVAELEAAQRSVELSRDQMEAELAEDLFLKTVDSALQRIDMILVLEKQTLQDAKSTDTEALVASASECEVVLGFQIDFCNALVNNNAQARARNEAYIYLSQLLNAYKTTSSVETKDDTSSRFADYMGMFRTNPATCNSETKPYWASNLGCALIGQIVVEIDRDSLQLQIRKAAESKPQLSDEVLRSKLDTLSKKLRNRGPKEGLGAAFRSRIEMKPLSIINNRAQGKKLRALPKFRPLPSGIPRPPPPKGKQKPSAGQDFEFL
jgi:hypothetical protein